MTTIAVDLPPSVRVIDLMSALADLAVQDGNTVKQGAALPTADGKKLLRFQILAKPKTLKVAA